MSCVTIRGCRIGEGRPKVIIPIVERTEDAVLQKAAAFAPLCADCVEWRADWLETVSDAASVQRCLRGLHAALGEKLLLVTLRTKAEGGEAALSAEAYASFCHTVCASGCADLLDMELFTAGEQLPALIAEAHAAGVRVIVSSHDFEKTPSCGEMTARMVQMQSAGADIAKLAVMPHCEHDVEDLICATRTMAAQHPETPVITMSMGALGQKTRIIGEEIGSAMTFACVGKASAPGQFELDEMNRLLDLAHAGGSL